MYLDLQSNATANPERSDDSVGTPGPRIPFQKLPKSLAAMAVFSLFFGRQLGESLVQLRKVKQRVVTKTVCAARGSQQFASRFAVEGLYRAPMFRNRNYADKFS